MSRELDILEGKTEFSPTDIVPMRIGDTGPILNVPGDKVSYHIGRGARLVEPQELDAYDRAKDAGALGIAAVSALNIADTALLGVPKTILKHSKVPEGTKMMIDEIEKSSIVPDIASAAGVVATMGEGALSKPFSTVVKGAESITSKTPLRKIVNGIRESQVEERIAANGLVDGATRFAKGVGKEAAKGATRGAYIGAAIGVPSASIDALFGDTQEAGETLLYSAGIGAGFEGILGGILGGVRNISEISDGIRGSTNRLLKRNYGVGEEALNATDGIADDIMSKAKMEHTQNIARLARTSEELGVPASNLTPEAVFFDPQKAEAARIAEIRATPFGGEASTQDQRALFEQAAIKAVKERVLPEMEKFRESQARLEDIAGKESFNLQEKAIGRLKAVNDYHQGLQKGADDIINGVTNKISGLNEQEIARHIEESFLQKAKADIEPPRRLMQASDHIIQDVPLKNKNTAIEFESLSDADKRLTEGLITRMSIDPFGKDAFGRPNTEQISRARANLNKMGYDYQDGQLVKAGSKIDPMARKINDAKNKTIEKMYEDVHKGKLSKEENEVIKEYTRRLKGIETGKELSELTMNARALREEKFAGGGHVRNINQRIGLSKVIGHMEDLSSDIKTSLGGESFVKIKEQALKNYAEVAKKWKPIIESISKKKMSNREIIHSLEEGDFRGEMINLTKSGFFNRYKALHGEFSKELGMASAHEIKLLADKHTRGGVRNLKSFFDEVARWDETKGVTAFGDKFQVIKQISTALRDGAPERTKAILEKILEKGSDIDSVTKAISKLEDSDLISVFGPEARKAKSILKQFESDKVLKSAYERIRDVSEDARFDVSKFIKEVSKLDNKTQLRIFGSSGKKLTDDINHLFKYVDITTKAKADDLISHMMHSGIHQIPGKILSVLDAARLRSEKEAIIKAAMNTEKEYQTKNMSKAVLKREDVFHKISKWAGDIVASGRVKLEPLSIVGTHHNLSDVKSEYEANMKTISEIKARQQTIIDDASNRVNHFGSMGASYIEYMNAINGFIQNVPVITPKNQNMFFKLPEIKPTKLEMIKLNSKMRVLKNPFAIIEDFSNGIVDREKINLATAVYPKTVERIRNTVQQKLLSGEVEANYQDRLKISSFLGFDLDGTMKHAPIFQMPDAQPLPQEKTNINIKQGLASDVQQLSLA